MTQQQQTINGFLVDVFNDVLRLEERSLRKERTGLSLTELHVLETVQRVSEERGGTMADVAAALGVTSGTLAIAVKTLEQKGYVRREREGAGRRGRKAAPARCAKLPRCIAGGLAAKIRKKP